MSLKVFLNKKSELKSKMDALVALSTKEERVFTDEEKTQFESLKSEHAGIKSQIELLQGYQIDEEEDKEVAAPVTSAAKSNGIGRVIPGDRPKTQFENRKEFIRAAMFNQNDPRLADCYQEYKSELVMGTGSKGGFAIPTYLRPQFLAEIAIDGAIVRPRATVIEGNPAHPDGDVSINAMDQEPNSAGTQQVFAGVTIYKVAEGGLKTDTTLNIRQISLRPEEFAAIIPMTDKLVRNADPISWADAALRKAMIAFEDTQFLLGNGVGGPKGCIDDASAYAVARATANTVTFVDLQALEERILGDNAVWVAARSVKAQLLAMTGQGGGATNIVSVDQSTGSISLYGKPVIFTGRVRALGSRGDIGLYDFSNYLIKDGSGPIIEAGYTTGQWERNKQSLKITFNVDGKSWLTKTHKDEAGFELSPFCVLDVPAAS